MHFIISATMRITLATLMLLGVCLFLLLGLLSITCELFGDEQRSSGKRERLSARSIEFTNSPQQSSSIATN
jgi:hypothetical protein